MLEFSASRIVLSFYQKISLIYNFKYSEIHNLKAGVGRLYGIGKYNSSVVSQDLLKRKHGTPCCIQAREDHVDRDRFDT